MLEALGARIDLGPEEIARCIDEVGFGFIFAPAHHQATRHVIGVRRELGVRTIFNLLGPLTNPAGATHQLVGVSDPRHLETIAGALVLLGVERALVVAGEDGLDEISATGADADRRGRGGELRAYTTSPAQLGITGAGAGPRGGTPQENAAVTRAILAGERGPHRELALANAGAAIYAADAAGTLAEGVERARAAVDDGRAARAAGALGGGDAEHEPSSPRSSRARARTWSAAAARCPTRRPGAARHPRAFRDALAMPGLSIIAEHKRRSPSAGEIRPGASVAEIARAYERGGAAAISVLTEERNFDGSLEDLRVARAACTLPLLRKDFILSDYQLAEADSAGADAVLLIVAALEPAHLRELHEGASARGLDALVEVHDADELAIALEDGCDDHRRQQPRPARLQRRDRAHLRAARGMPEGVLVVSESGIWTPGISGACARGVDAALIGERLMREEDPAGALRVLADGR